MSQKKWIVLLSLTLLSLHSYASNKVVYGEDNRRDLVQTSNPLFLKLASATAAMVKKTQIVSEGSGFSLSFTRTLETGANVCPNEKFAQQPIGAMCSGFLVGPDVLVTAGHCFHSLPGMTPENVCQNFSWVFNYSVNTSSRNPIKGFAANDVYHCKKIIKSTLGPEQDFAVIQLDRKVVGHEALKYRTSGKVSTTNKLVVIGHPDGLPSKIADGGKVLDNTPTSKFITNLDTFHGNSGSAVFDATTGVIEGILIQGKPDYAPSSNNFLSCKIVNVCSEDGLNCTTFGGPKGETVLRITEVSAFFNKKAPKPPRVRRK